MGDEDKIKDLVPLAKAEFLPEEVRDKEPPPQDYSIELEFAKAKANKNYSFYLIILIFLGVVIGGTVFYTEHLQSEIKEEKISFADMDLNLKEALSTDAEERKLNQAKNELQKIIKERDKKIEQIHLEYFEKIGVVKGKNIPESEKKTLIDNLKVEEMNKIKEVENDYAQEITDQESEVQKHADLLQKKKEKRDAEINKAEAMITNYKELQKMQIAKREAQITLRYNPVFASTKLQRILRKSRGSRIKQPILRSYEQRLYEAGLLRESEREYMKTKIDEYESVIARMQQIPYTNSVRPSIDVIQDSGFFLISEYERLVDRLSVRITAQNELIRKYNNAFRHYAESSPDSGFIIDASNDTDVLVSMKPLLTIEDGDEAYVFRSEDDLIATVVFKVEEGDMQVTVKEILPGRKIRPFDKIFLKRKDEMENGEMKKGEEASTETNGTGQIPEETNEETNGPEPTGEESQ